MAAMSRRHAQAGADKSTDPCTTASHTKLVGYERYPTNQVVFVGRFATVAAVLNDMAANPRLRGVMPTSDDFLIGMEQFGTRSSR